MTENSINLCSESYKFSITKGFSELQQQQEFVDVTIAAEGYLVKAHQNILALASPYIKAILQSTPCQHPIIFLSGIAHNVLAHILEYVYTGEVQIPCELYPSFVQAAKQMHIVGLDHYSASVLDPRTFNYDERNTNSSDQLVEGIPYNNISQSRKDSAEDVSDVQHEYRLSNSLSNGGADIIKESDLGSSDDKNKIIEIIHCETIKKPVLETNPENFTLDASREVDTEIEDLTTQNDYMQNQYSQMPSLNTHVPESHEQEVLQDHQTGPLYTISIRGSLMMILNRFLYNMHHQSANGAKRRWRCIDYRRKHCLAYVDTQDEVITGRKNTHTHGFHDSKILTIGTRKNVFTSLRAAKK